MAYTRLCKVCRQLLRGRSDKIFCSLHCKNHYHANLRRATKRAAYTTDKILHRNRSILLEIMGNHRRQQQVDRKVLDKKKFNYHYLTGYYLGKTGKIYHYVYDFSWVLLAGGKVRIFKRSSA